MTSRRPLLLQVYNCVFDGPANRHAASPAFFKSLFASRRSGTIRIFMHLGNRTRDCQYHLDKVHQIHHQVETCHGNDNALQRSNLHQAPLFSSIIKESSLGHHNRTAILRYSFKNILIKSYTSLSFTIALVLRVFAFRGKP